MNETPFESMQNEAPTLSFGDAMVSMETGETVEPVVEQVEEVAPELNINMDDSMLSETEKTAVDQFAKQIDLHNTQGIMQYGSGVQKKMSDFSESTLESVRTRDLGEVGELLTSVVAEVKNFDQDENQKGIKGLFKKTANKVEMMKAKYDKAEVNINKICDALKKHQVTLLKDVSLFDKMFELNMNYYKELTMYILAGKKKLDEVRTGELAELRKLAERTGKTEDAQKAKDLSDQCDRFEKKLYDLDLTRTICLQTGPQIRLLQNADIQMAEKIQSVLVNTIPLWKNQMVIALGISHSTEAIKAESAVTDATNALLKKNAESLHTASVEAAKANERGIVDIETLKATNASLIQTLDDVMKIQQEGKQKRAAAEEDLKKIEEELKQKLIEVSKK